jgi:hypothetical protein
MPLTECRRAVAILAEDFGVVLGVVGAPALITRETRSRSPSPEPTLTLW